MGVTGGQSCSLGEDGQGVISAPRSSAGPKRLFRVSRMPAIIDTHCHLADSRMYGELEPILERAASAGVGAIVSVGAIGSIQTDRTTVEIAERHANVFAVIGVHPHDARDCDPRRMAEIKELAQSKKVVAIGETGIDLHYRNSSQEAQGQSLRLHLRLANELGLPVVIHCRDAEPIVAGIVAQEGMPAAGGAIHCFTGNSDDAGRFLSMGFYLSFSGIVTFKNAAALRQTVPLVPDDRLLIETDAPYLAPEPHRGKRNEPAFVALTLNTIARIRRADASELAGNLALNSARLFRFEIPAGGQAFSRL